MSTTHNAETLLNGQFTVTGTETTAASTLAAGITSSSASLQLANASGFAPIGVIKIDDEKIYYTKVQGNILSGLTRAKAASTAAAHAASAAVNQSQCYLSSTAAIPTMASATAIKSTVSSVILMNLSLSVGGYSPSVSSTGTVLLKGTTAIANPSSSVVLNGANFAGSTVVSTQNNGVKFQGNGHTAVNNSSGVLTESSDKHDQLADVVENASLSGSLFQTFFGTTATPTSIQALATTQGQYYASFNHSAVNGVTNKVIWINNDTDLQGDLSVGSATAPVVMVVNGDLLISNNETLTLYGIIYVTGEVEIENGNAYLQGEGSLGAEGDVTVGSGNASISLSMSGESSVINDVYSNLIPGGGTLTYTTQDLGIQATYH
mgnify:CR=1 FL=1